MAETIFNQKQMLRELSERLIKYIKNPTDPDALKPYYLFKMGMTSNDITSHLIGYRFQLDRNNEFSSNLHYSNPMKINLTTRSKTQIRESMERESKNKLRITVPILGSKSLLSDDWIVEPQPNKYYSTYTISINAIEGEVYSDAVWLQDYDPKFALEILLNNKRRSIDKAKKALENQMYRYDLMEEAYSAVRILYENKGD